jgi:hypothetical protein
MKVLPKAHVNGSRRPQQHCLAVKDQFMKLFSIKLRLQNAMRVLAQLYPYRRPATRQDAINKYMATHQWFCGHN